ncbi:NAD-P-binding protein [Trametes gibbosa]|nr:NAD-P-binding protein [Trametes gibbosa]KAI0828232.1 NAD-P-binding protein [Trametes gibbosa]
MRLLILGGTGPSGLLIIEQALALDHSLVVYVRSPQKLPGTVTANPAVSVVEGQLTDKEKLLEALNGVHAVVSALGPARDVKRLILLGTASMKDDNDKFSLQFAVLVGGVALFAHNAYKDVVAIGQTVRAADEDIIWTIARVPLLTEKPETDFVAGYIGDSKTGTRLARAAFAAFVLKELETNEWCRKAPLVSSP